MRRTNPRLHVVELMRNSVTLPGKGRVRCGRQRWELLEELETRILLSTYQSLASLRQAWARRAAKIALREGHTAHTNLLHKAGAKAGPKATSINDSGLTAAKVRKAYGIDQVMFGSVVGDGAGQTVAIIDAYHYPTALSDLNAFDAVMGLPDLQAWSAGGNTGPWMRVVSQTGGTNYPSAQAPASNSWEVEEALDIQWVHAIAPAANIILVEANSAFDSDLLSAAVAWARAQPGVSAVSMSFSQSELSGQGTYDNLFTTPAGHTGITFLAATGDSGQPSGYPAFSPNVVAVGGTSLSVAADGTYISESGWSGSGGSLSTVYAQPSYQVGVVTQSTTKRANPDVAMNADPGSGVWIYDSYDFPTSPWQVYGGTSLATPMWAGLMAIVNQGRVLSGQTALDGKTQTLPKLYALPASDFHDITTGNNGFAAGPGYDLVTGRGTPVGNLLIQDLVTPPSTAPGTPDLVAASDTGTSGTDNITTLDNSSAAKKLTFTVTATIAGATVSVFADGNLIGSVVATGSSTDVTTNGAYALASGVHAITATQTQPGLGQSPASGALPVTVDTAGATVTGQTPSGQVIGAQSDVKFTFSEAVDVATFSLADITSFQDPSGNDIRGQLTGFSWSAGNTVLDVFFNAQSAVGNYQMVIGPQILDLAGNAMAGSYTGGFGILATVYAALMDSNPGWALDAGSAWAWGVPQGLGTSNHDPTSGHTGSNVVGYNLAGNYAKNIGPYYATTPAIDATNYQGLTLTFWRWLGVRTGATATVQASSDGGATWTTLYSSSGTVTDSAWVQQSFALPAAFNGKSAIKFRWGMGPTGSNTTYPGWNVDDVTVTGSPFVPPSISGQVFVDANGNGSLESGEAGIAGASVFLDLNGNGVADAAGTTVFNSTNVPVAIPDLNAAGATSSLSATNIAGTITKVTITFNITHTFDGDLTGYLIAPDGTQITLFASVGGSGANFAGTTLNDSAATSISSASAPFSGTYRPGTGALSAFNGRTAAGTWQFKVVDGGPGDVGTINSWSLAISTNVGDPVTTTDAGGNYHFNVAAGTYTVREVLPTGYVAVSGLTHTVSAAAAVTGQNFGNFPTTFGPANDGDAYYVTASGGNVQIFAGPPVGNPTWQIAAGLIPGLTFNLTGANQTLVADFSGGLPLGMDLTINGVAGNGGTLVILGQGSAQGFTMTDYQIGLTAGGGVIHYNTLDGLDLVNCRVDYSGSLATLQNLTVDSGCIFYWS